MYGNLKTIAASKVALHVQPPMTGYTCQASNIQKYYTLASDDVCLLSFFNHRFATLDWLCTWAGMRRDGRLLQYVPTHQLFMSSVNEKINCAYRAYMKLLGFEKCSLGSHDILEMRMRAYVSNLHTMFVWGSLHIKCRHNKFPWEHLNHVENSRHWGKDSVTIMQETTLACVCKVFCFRRLIQAMHGYPWPVAFTQHTRCSTR